MAGPRTAFDADAGTSQGRIIPTGWDPPSGDYVLVLGHDLPGVVRKIAPGDGVELAQTIDFAHVSALRARAKIRAPEVVPVGLAWGFSAFVNGDKIFGTTITRNRELYDFALPVGAYASSGPVPVELVLSLDGASGLPVEVELPAVYFDAFASDTVPSEVGLFNRDPEPNETGVPLDLPVSFLITDPSGVIGLDLSTFTVTIGGVLAYINFSGVNGFAADIGQTADGLGLIVALTPPEPWTSLVTYSVQVQVLTNDGFQYDQTYSWTAADTIAPVVLEALALDPLTVRVTFDEPMTDTGTGTALDPAAYTFALVSGAPAITPVAVAVAAQSSRAVLVTLDRYATRGALYSVTVAGAEDLFGNAVAPPNDTATFTGFAWEGPEGRDIDLFRMMPEVVQQRDVSGEHQRFLAVLQEIFDLFFAIADKAQEVWDPDLAPEGFLDLMLAELGNPFQLALTLNEKRRLVQTLVPIYQRKGTGPGIVAVIRFFTGIEVSLRMFGWSPYPIGVAIIGQTWVLGTDDLVEKYTFEVVISDFITDEQRAIIVEVLDVMRVAHEHYRLIEPVPVVTYNHWQLNYSMVGTQTILH